MALAPTHADAVALSILTTKEAAAYLRLSASRLAVLRSKGGGPRYIAQSSRKCLYRRADLDAWLEARAVSNTGEAVA